MWFSWAGKAAPSSQMLAGTPSQGDISRLLAGDLTLAKDCGRKVCRGINPGVMTSLASPGGCK